VASPALAYSPLSPLGLSSGGGGQRSHLPALSSTDIKPRLASTTPSTNLHRPPRERTAHGRQYMTHPTLPRSRLRFPRLVITHKPRTSPFRRGGVNIAAPRKSESVSSYSASRMDAFLSLPFSFELVRYMFMALFTCYILRSPLRNGNSWHQY